MGRGVVSDTATGLGVVEGGGRGVDCTVQLPPRHVPCGAAFSGTDDGCPRAGGALDSGGV